MTNKSSALCINIYMADDVIVRQHIDDLLTTSTLAGAQSTLDIKTDIYTTVQTNSGTWGEVNTTALNTKANRHNAVLTGVLSATGSAIINVNSSTLAAVRIMQTGTADALLVEDSAATDATPFVINSQGNVGIGRLPDVKLDVSSSNTIARFSGTISENNGIAINNDYAGEFTYRQGYLDFRNENDITVSKVAGTVETNGSSNLTFSTTPSGDRDVDRLAVRLVIKGNGNVGIGTSSPSAKLHVNGDIRCDGAITFGTLNTNSLSVANSNGTLFIPTSAKVLFGNSFENSDSFFIQRLNTANNLSELRICLGDDPQASSPIADSITIGVSSGNPGWFIPWQPKIVLGANGFISCFGDYTPSQHSPLTANPAVPVRPEHVTTKHYVDQLQTPPGAIMAFAMNTAPTGWLSCSGQQVSRSIYSKLFSAIGTTYGAGNGTTTFTLPDLRGEFVRGWDNNRGIDSGRVFGSSQKGTITVVDPNLNNNNVTGIYSQGENNTTTFATEAGYDIINVGDYSGVRRASIAGTGSGDLQTNGFGQGATRPRNIALHYCIKY